MTELTHEKFRCSLCFWKEAIRSIGHYFCLGWWNQKMKKHIHSIRSYSVVSVSQGLEFGTVTNEVFLNIFNIIGTLHLFASLGHNILKPDSLLFEVKYYRILFEFETSNIWVLALSVHPPSPLNFNGHKLFKVSSAVSSDECQHRFLYYFASIKHLQLLLSHHQFF